MDFNKLSLKEKIGQKFIFGVNSDNMEIIIKLIKEYYIGGVILYKKNYSDINSMMDVIKRLKDANKDNKIPLFISIDQEGGRVNRMPQGFHNLKNIYEMSMKDCELIDRNADITGRMLNAMGINMNFAPVLDIYDGKSKVLYNRCFYGDYENIYNCGLKYIKGLCNKGVISVVKHFPGHGATNVDSHFLTPYVYDYKKVLEKHIIPFDMILDSNNNDFYADCVMVNHIVINKLTDLLPASISKKFINKYLRIRNKFNGLVITDEMNMLSRNIIYKFNYLKKMFECDADIYLFKIKKENEAVRVINKYNKFINNNDDYMKILDDSVKRIIDIKNKYNISDRIDNDGFIIDDINKEIDEINKLCL